MNSGRGNRGGGGSRAPRPRGTAPETGGGGGRGCGGGGRGRGGCGRRAPLNSGERLALEHDVVPSRPEGLPTKKGTTGTSLALLANYYPLVKRASWGLFHYRVDFKPEEHLTSMKKALLRDLTATFGLSIFDGHSLYTPNRLSPDPMRVNATRPTDRRIVEITIRLVGQVAQVDSMTLHFYNIVVRKCLESLKLEEMGRHFFDRMAAVKLPNLRLELWPGFVTSMRHHENEVLLCVEPIHKVLRTDSVLTIILHHQGKTPLDYKHHVARDVIGNVVMTGYNRKTYRVDDIKWDMSPKSTFKSSSDQGKGTEKTDEEVTYMEYYRVRYDQKITNPGQPLLVSLPRRKDHHRGTGPIYLIPELCQMTGLTDEMRVNNTLMQEVSTHLHMAPTVRHDKITGFMGRLQGSPEIQKELKGWGLKFSNKLVEVPGRTLPLEKVFFSSTLSNGTRTIIDDLPNRDGEWTDSLKRRQMISPVALNCWVIVVPIREAGKEIDELIVAMRTNKMGFKIAQPSSIIKIPNVQPDSYDKGINQAATFYKNKLEMIFVILPNNKLDTYKAIKRRCCVEYGVPSQCLIAKGIKSKNFPSIVSKFLIQMNAKLGGVPWQIDMPIKNTMFLGFDVYHCANRRGASVGALVASTSANVGQYYSTVSFHKDKNELSSNLCGDISKAMTAYFRINGTLPRRVILYRDGIGEGQLSYVYNTELLQIQNALKLLYAEKELPKFSFIVVTKKINTRMFEAGTKGNPPAGTIADDVITLPERHDFFLISQNSRQGTVSPTAYNVLFDQQGLTSDQLQRITYKLCHLYYNCSSTVAVPAPCQYAHKLAYLTGMALATKCSENLTNRLYYL